MSPTPPAPPSSREPSSATTALFATQDDHLQHLHQGHSRYTRHSLARGDIPPPLDTWLRCALKLPPRQAEDNTLSAGAAANWRGWAAYNAADLAAASCAFADALKHPMESAARTEVPLGIGKVLTRTGRWDAARDWLLLALAEARRADRLYDSVRAYGALGELFLRGGQSADAYFCLSTAHRLLPPGAGERSRQLNYLASALMRLGTERDRSDAESLLMTSLYLALDTDDATSAWHALARLQFLELDRGGNRDMLVVMNTTSTLNAAPLAEGLLTIGRTFAAHRRGDSNTASHLAEQARGQLAITYPMESFWAARIHHAMGGAAPTPISPAPQLPPCPSMTAVIDRDWQRLPLPVDVHPKLTHFRG